MLVLVPIYVKHVEEVFSANEKDRCSVMIILDMFSNITLPPLIIFTGKFGKTLMKT